MSAQGVAECIGWGFVAGMVAVGMYLWSRRGDVADSFRGAW